MTVAAGSGVATDVVWGQGRGRGTAGDFHRLPAFAHGSQVVACGETVDVVHTYHCDPKSGAAAEPVIGAVCPACRRVQQERNLVSDGGVR